MIELRLDPDLPVEQHVWERAEERPDNRYVMSRWAIGLNEITEGLLDDLPLTDSRRRPDQRLLEQGQ
ncbi:hypothetical protein CYMTET_47548 [Cymbomonas tetramitiformis]|uniref:Uncharacterized protein n=1 Tax=Cymbomonas tetramitiformis TaxID=36881 RepID=A0AAE0BVD1_9CHLO|nr:hypothetical protein CYMTET_47548 [Cymbomonas tetramitiformis]